jgi:hypothetical protein
MNLPKKYDRTVFRLSVLAVSLFLVAFEVLRAARATFYFDEANTFLNYLSSNVLALFNFNSANNHFLNTVLAKLFSAVGGTSELILRLPNLLGFVIYLLFSYLLVDRFIKNKLVAVCGFLWLSLNPYVLEFFSLCRGYGLSLACLMAALFFFFSFLDKTIKSEPEGPRHLRYSLAAASLGVLANFNLLNVYLSLVVVALGFFAVLNSKGKLAALAVSPGQNHAQKKLFLLAVLAVSAVVFNLLVIAQDFSLAEKFFEPVTVKISGLDELERQDIQVFRVDIKNEEQPLIYKDGLWRLEQPAYFTAVKFRCRPSILSNIKQIQILLGPETFAYEASDLAKLRNVASKKYSVFSSQYSMSLKRSIIPAFKPVINWKGDQALVSYSLRRFLVVLAFWVLGLAILLFLGRLLARGKILTPFQYRPLAGATFLLMMFIGYPIYLLKTGGALWYGGRTGFIRNTVFSLINNSFYGELYFRRQEWAVFVVVCLVLIGLLSLLFGHYRKRTMAEVLPGLSTVSILVLASVASVLQSTTLGNPYPIGRTALFFIPLFTLALIFLFQYLSRGKARLKMISVSLAAVLTMLSIYHFSERADTAMTVESRSEADTKSMLKDLQGIRGKDLARYPGISLGIENAFYPSLQYYLRRGDAAWLEVHGAPPYKGNDFYYLKDTFDGARIAGLRMIVIKRYPNSGNILLKSEFE